MNMKNIRSEELVVGKEYSLLDTTMTMIISFANGGMLAKYGGLQMRFLVVTGTMEFYVGEGVQFLPVTSGSIFKIVAKKTDNNDKNIKPVWKYFLYEHKNES